MPAIPKLLTTRHLTSDDAGKAGYEAMLNAYRLLQAGQFDAALRVLEALVSPGSWRMSRQFPYRYEMLCHLMWLAARLGRAVDLGEEDDHLRMARLTASAGVLPDFGMGFGKPPAPRGWTAAELAATLATVEPDKFGHVFNNFRDLARDELRRRIGARTRGEARPDAGDHGAIADTIERGALLAFPRHVHEQVGEILAEAALLDVFHGHRDAAIARLASALPKQPPSLDAHLWQVPAYADFLASGAMGPALGIDAAGTAAYLEAFASRSPYTITATKPKPWKQVLKAWVERLQEDGLDAEQLQETVAAGAPASKLLLAKAKKGQPLNAAAKEDAVAALEARVGQPLPPSYRDFLLTADGVIVPYFVALLPAAQVDWLHVLDPHTVEAWNEGADEVTDEQYAVYGADQDCVHFRPRHLHQALQVSTLSDGDVLLLVPGVRFGDEWEAWFLGAKNPGAFRFKSFRALMEQQVLAEDG